MLVPAVPGIALSRRKEPDNAPQKGAGHLKDRDTFIPHGGFIDTTQFKVGIKSGSAGGTGHEHSANVGWKPQPLPALRAYLFYRISHGFLDTPIRAADGRQFRLRGWKR